MTYEPSTNLDYIACKSNCDPKDPQPLFDVVTTTSEACLPAIPWREITYRDYNGDYNPKELDSITDKVVEDYDPRDVNNAKRTPDVYKRSPLNCCNP